MHINTLIKHLKIHLDLSLEMLLDEIDACPDAVWNKKAGGFIFWQQILHSLTGLSYWTRIERKKFIEPFKEREVFPELDHEPKGSIEKEEMKTYGSEVKNQVELFFRDKDDEWLKEKNILYNKIINLDIIEMQIRHLQYHVGHCNSILRERNIKAVEWKDYFG